MKVLLLTVLVQAVLSTDLNQHATGGQNPDAELKAQADAAKLIQPSGKVADGSKYLFNISNAGDTLALFQTIGPMVIVLDEKSSGKKAAKNLYLMDGSNTVTGTRAGDKISLSMKYTDSGANATKDFLVKKADIKMEILSGKSSPKAGYWIVKSISMSLTYSLKQGQDQTKQLDLTPVQGYTKRVADLACGAGYSVCAPLSLAWTCTDQKLQKVDVAVGSDAIILHMPGLAMQPFKAGETLLRFGNVWDCDPLIPLSIWVSVGITLLLASIVWWALAMLSAIYSPSKFDDPKGPGLQIAQTD